MIRSCIRQAVRAFAGAAFFSCALAANAANISINDTNCDSFALAGTPPNQTLTCVVSSAPTGCSISGPSTGSNGNPITLTAVCSSGSPNSYAWIGGNCGNVITQSCQDTQTQSQTITYKVTPSNGFGAGNQATKPVVWSASLPVKPSSCSITANTNPLPAGGGTVNLTAQCAGGDAVDTWTWTGPPSMSSSGNTATALISISSTFGVTATNGGGSGTASVTVNVTGSGGGGSACSGFLNTNVVVMNWPNWTSNLKIPMGTLDAGILQFSTGPASSRTGSLTLYSGSGGISDHDVFVSTTKCDFQTNVLSNGLTFSVGQKLGSWPMLQANTTYYVNIRNSAGAVCLGGSATGALCDVFVNSSKP